MSPSIPSLSGPRFGGDLIDFPAPEDRAPRLAHLRLARGLQQALAGPLWREFAEPVITKLLALVEEPCDDAGRAVLQEQARLLGIFWDSPSSPPQIGIEDCKRLVRLCLGDRDAQNVSSIVDLLFADRYSNSALWRHQD